MLKWALPAKLEVNEAVSLGKHWTKTTEDGAKHIDLLGLELVSLAINDFSPTLLTNGPSNAPHLNYNLCNFT